MSLHTVGIAVRVTAHLVASKAQCVWDVPNKNTKLYHQQYYYDHYYDHYYFYCAMRRLSSQSKVESMVAKACTGATGNLKSRLYRPGPILPI